MCIRDRAGNRDPAARAGRNGRHSGARARIAGAPVSYTHLRAHETGRNLVCRLLLEKKKKTSKSKRRGQIFSINILILFFFFFFNDTATTEIYTRSLVGSVRCV